MQKRATISKLRRLAIGLDARLNDKKYGPPNRCIASVDMIVMITVIRPNTAHSMFVTSVRLQYTVRCVRRRSRAYGFKDFHFKLRRNERFFAV